VLAVDLIAQQWLDKTKTTRRSWQKKE